MIAIIVFIAFLFYCETNIVASNSSVLSKADLFQSRVLFVAQNEKPVIHKTKAPFQNLKPKNENIAHKFHLETQSSEQADSLVALLKKITAEYLEECPSVIYSDNITNPSEEYVLRRLFKIISTPYYHGRFKSTKEALNMQLDHRSDINCKSYILFLSDPFLSIEIIGPQIKSRVLIIARSTQWKVREFLSSGLSSNIVNLLIVGESFTEKFREVRPYVLYTHNLYNDGLGSNTPKILASWINGALSQPRISLFPKKLTKGFAGHRFQALASNQPPFIFQMKSINAGGGLETRWDGIEYHLLKLISNRLNFSFDISEPIKSSSKAPSDIIKMEVQKNQFDIGMAGIYITNDHLRDADMSVGHSQDCASFITLASKALPSYRAIMGPFQWPVWTALIFVYLGAVFPIAFTDRLTLRHLISNWSEIENMFWYVFGMFTNSLTFSGKYSWTNSRRLSTRLLIGFYWIFTIIITACYTGSIISFVTIPRFPDTVDSVHDLMSLFFKVGTLDRGGWEMWFQNSTHEVTAKLLKKMEYVASLEEGIRNVTQSFFWKYAFLGSRAQLEYLVQSNFTEKDISRRSALHLSEECFVLFQIGYLFPDNSVYKEKINEMILLAQQSGLIAKIQNDVSWTMQRSSTNTLLQVSKTKSGQKLVQEERQLTTADTEGMFLLLGIGYMLALIAFASEIIGGFTNKCRQIILQSRKSISSTWSSRRTSTSFINSEQIAANLEIQSKLERCTTTVLMASSANGIDSNCGGDGKRILTLGEKENAPSYESCYKRGGSKPVCTEQGLFNLLTEPSFYMHEAMTQLDDAIAAYEKIDSNAIEEIELNDNQLSSKLFEKVSIEANLFGSFVCHYDDDKNISQLSQLDYLNLFE